MSFLFRRKKIFLFVFLFFAFTLPLVSFGKTNNQYTDSVLDGILSTYSFGMAIVSPLAIVLGFLAMSISAILLGIATYAFNLSLEIGVLGISDIVHGSNAIKDSWLIFRNLANVGIIFVILFIAIKTILRMDGFDQKFLLGRVIIAALLMNFSFFFGAVVVDVSNQMAITIYDRIGQVVTKDENGEINLGGYYFEKTNSAVYALAVQSTVDKNSENYFSSTLKTGGLALAGPLGVPFALTSSILNIKTDWQKGVVLAQSYFLAAITSLVLAVAMFIGAAMIIGRIIAIILLLTVAPLAFAANILPNTQKFSKEWWGSLIGHSFYLPVFLLFIYIGVQVTDNLPQSLQTTKKVQENILDFAGLIKTLAPVAFNFGIIIGLYVAALVIAKKMSSQGNAVVGKISASVTGASGAIMAQQAAFLGRNTIGRGAEMLSNTQWAQKMGTTRVGSLALDQLKGVAKNSFDAREARVFKGVASATGLGGDFKDTLGPQKGGFLGAVERSEKAKIERSKNLSDELSETTKAEIKTTEEDKKKKQAEMDDFVTNHTDVAKAQERLDDYETELEAAKTAGDVVKMKALKKDIVTAKKSLESEKERAKTDAGYKTLEGEQKTLEDKAKELESKSLRRDYGRALKKPWIENEKFGKAAGWIPFNGRMSDAKAAKKILETKSEYDKFFEKVKREIDSSK